MCVCVMRRRGWKQVFKKKEKVQCLKSVGEEGIKMGNCMCVCVYKGLER